MTQKYVREARSTLGLSQSQMTRALGLTSVMTYTKWESGVNKPNAAALAAIEMLLYMNSVGVLDGWIAMNKKTDQ